MAKPAKEPEIKIPDIKRKRPELRIRCGQCMFLTRYKTYAQACADYGTVPSSLPCARFTADPSQLGHARQVRDVLRVIGSAEDPTLLTSILLSARRVRRTGYGIGEVVYFKVCGADYLNNYASGVVTGVNGKNLVIAGALGFSAVMSPGEIMGRKHWISHRDSLIDNERINDPSGGLRRIPVRGRTRLVSYEPPEAGPGKHKSRLPKSSFSGKKPRGRKKQNGPIVLSSGDQRYES